MAEFETTSAYRPTGDQPTAVATLAEGLRAGERYQTLLGATGTGKTATMAWLIEELGRPALVIAHNKTLAAQLCNEFREFFPGNAVEYFVSYYDYYQPEAYVPQADLYIEKDSSQNDDIARLRLAATSALFTRRDVVVVASVSCIYGLGSPEEWRERVIILEVGEEHDRDLMLRKLIDSQYVRNDTMLGRGRFRVKGDVVADDRARRFRDPPRAGGERQAAGDRREDARGAPAPAAHGIRPRDDAGARLLQRDRELLAHPRRTRPRDAPVHPARLFPQGLRRLRRRIAPDYPADRRDARGRPLAQANAGRLRLPPAVCARQPAASVRRVPRQGSAAGVRVRDAGAVRRAPCHPCGRAADQADRRRRPRGGAACDAQPDRRPAQRDPPT